MTSKHQGQRAGGWGPQGLHRCCTVATGYHSTFGSMPGKVHCAYFRSPTCPSWHLHSTSPGSEVDT